MQDSIHTSVKRYGMRSTSITTSKSRHLPESSLDIALLETLSRNQSATHLPATWTRFSELALLSAASHSSQRTAAGPQPSPFQNCGTALPNNVAAASRRSPAAARVGLAFKPAPIIVILDSRRNLNPSFSTFPHEYSRHTIELISKPSARPVRRGIGARCRPGSKMMIIQFAPVRRHARRTEWIQIVQINHGARQPSC
jgi:hypothetical protein